MKTKKLISLILTAALALSACASAADSATTATPAETAAATPEPTAAPEPVGELHARCRNRARPISAMRFVRPVPALDDAGQLYWNRSFTKQTLNARQTTALYEYNDNTYSPLCQFLANNTLYVVMYRDDSDTKLLAVPLDGGEVWETPLGPNAWGTICCTMTAMSTVCLISQAPTSCPPVGCALT